MPRFRPLILAALLSTVAFAAFAQDAGELLDRIQRLEAQVRNMNGQLEQVQFQKRELENQMKRLQGDVEFRLNELEKKGGAARPSPPPQQRKSDAFDPTTQVPVQGATPQPLGSATLVAPVQNNAQPQIMASSPKDEFDQGLEQMKRREYAGAEQTFRAFVLAHPKDKFAAEAYYQIGESLFLRRQYNDAAAAFLKIPTDYQKSIRAPASLLRLGQTFKAMGAKEEACGAFAEVNRKFPNSPASLKKSVATEQQNTGCGI